MVPCDSEMVPPVTDRPGEPQSGLRTEQTELPTEKLSLPVAFQATLGPPPQSAPVVIRPSPASSICNVPSVVFGGPELTVSLYVPVQTPIRSAFDPADPAPPQPATPSSINASALFIFVPPRVD